jgi:hypothetical protein
VLQPVDCWKMDKRADKGVNMADDIVYESHVRIERDKGPLRRAWLPAEREPVLFGVHSEIAAHYKVDPSKIEPHATTLDYVVAAAAG